MIIEAESFKTSTITKEDIEEIEYSKKEILI
jgi:hypothetical protein